MENYEIELGIGLNDSDFNNIKTKLKSLEDDGIDIKLNTKEVDKQIESIKKQLQDLSSGNNKNLLTFDTSKLESSLLEVKNVIVDIKKSLVSLDGKGMKDIAVSINQMATALGKAENESESLVKSLSALSKKEFNFNFGINMGKSNSVERQGLYGSHVRNETLPQLKKQKEALEDYLMEYYKVNDEFNAMLRLTRNSSRTMGGELQGLYDVMSGYETDNKKASLNSQMDAYRRYISIIKEFAALDDKIDISGITSSFSKSADNLIKDAEDIRTGANEMEESFEKLKQIFGGGNSVDGGNLSIQLESVVADLGEIKTAIQGLSSGASLDGLIQSFNRLSETLDRVASNFNNIKDVLNSGLIDNKVVQSAQQTGQKIGESIKQSAEKSLTLDDVIDQQVTELMDKYAIAGKKGSKAFDEIRQAIVEYRKELALADSAEPEFDEEFLIFSNSADIKKATSALASHVKHANEAKETYRDLLDYVRDFNTKGAKVHLPESIRQEYGDDFRSMRSSLGAAFTTGQGQDFESFIMELNGQLGNVIDLSQGAEAAFGDLVNKVNSAKGSKFLSDDELFDYGILNFEEVKNDITTAVNNINSAEQKMANISDSVTSEIIQNEERKQQAYKATTDTVMYHAGIISKLNKAETNGRFYGSNRGTGYFGTGHYFVDSATKHELDNNSQYSKKPYTSIDISQYDNLFKVTSDEVGNALHNFLRNLTRFTQGADDYNMSELFAQFKKVFTDTTMDVSEFGAKLDQLKNYMSNSDMSDRGDSVSTQFMKSLGYGGVDTRGTKFADTRYGTVIYDLKEESILQANITDEIQKQGQMLEKINYEKGQVFDKDEDARIQGILDKQNIHKEIMDEFYNSFDNTNYEKALSDLTEAQARLKEVDRVIADCEYSMANVYEEAEKFANEMKSFGLDYTNDEKEDWIASHTESMQQSIDNYSKEKAELESRMSLLEETFNREAQLQEGAYNKAKQIVEQRHLETQQSQQSADAVVQSEERKQQAYRETANTYDKILKDTSLVRDDVDFQKTFEPTNQAAQEAKMHFQELLADEKAVVSVTEQFDDGNALQSFAVNIKRANSEVETLRYSLEKLDDETTGDFVYRGASANDKSVVNQLEKQIKKANDLEIKLDKIKSNYSDMNSAKPIKDSGHITSLDEQYNKVKNAILDVKNADDSTFTSMIYNAEREKAALENMVREYRNAETVATSLRSKDIDTVKATYDSKLDVLTANMRKSDVYTSGFERGANNLRSILSNATDSSGLVKFLNGLDKLSAGYKRATAYAKEFSQVSTYGKRASGLEAEIRNLQRIDPKINNFQAEINGAKVSIQSLLKDLGRVRTKGDFDSVNEDLKAFRKFAEAAGIAVTEVAQKTKSIDSIRMNFNTDTYYNQFSQMQSNYERLITTNEELKASCIEVENAYKELNRVYDTSGTSDEVADKERLIQAEERYVEALKKTNNLIKVQSRADKAIIDSDKLDDDRKLFQADIDKWLVKNSAATKQFGATMLDLKAKAEGVDRVTLNGLIRQFKLADKQAEKLGLNTQSTFDRLKTKFKEYTSYLSAAEIFMYAEQAFRSMFEQVKLIDSAMTELKKVTDETNASYDRFLTNAASRAREIGTTIDGLVESTAGFARLGYDFTDAQGLAEVANIYAVVGDEVEGVEGATESLISTMAAFKDEMNGMSNTDFAMSIIDKFNEIGNNFAITSGGIGEALKRSASSLMAANNTIDESIALITAANQVVQDPSQVGTSFKTISMRIRGAKTELEEAGLETDGMVESTAKLREEILALSGIDIMKNG